MTLASLLAESIISKPDIIQFAKDRKYEEAWIIPLSGGRPSQQQIADYLAKGDYQLLIVEYIWNSQIDNQRFVLTVFLDQKCQLQDHRVFVNICLEMFFDYKDFLSFIEKFDQRIIGRSYLLRNLPEMANMGIFNYWLSVGPVDLWNKGEKLDLDKIRQKIEARQNIKKSKLNYQGLLFRFNVSQLEDGPSYGLKTPCCKKIGDEWAVDYELVNGWMERIIN